MKNSDFDREYLRFLDLHLLECKGERIRRLKEGHGYLEKQFLKNVWWPAFGHFRWLQPEYEVMDFVDGTRFLDFAYLRPPYRSRRLWPPSEANGPMAVRR